MGNEVSYQIVPEKDDHGRPIYYATWTGGAQLPKWADFRELMEQIAFVICIAALYAYFYIGLAFIAVRNYFDLSKKWDGTPYEKDSRDLRDTKVQE